MPLSIWPVWPWNGRLHRTLGTWHVVIRIRLCYLIPFSFFPSFLNSRPSFRCFTWHTCALGILGCLVMMFLINAIYAFVSIVFMVLLLMLIQYLGPISNWGYISQALIFHQVGMLECVKLVTITTSRIFHLGAQIPFDAGRA